MDLDWGVMIPLPQADVNKWVISTSKEIELLGSEEWSQKPLKYQWYKRRGYFLPFYTFQESLEELHGRTARQDLPENQILWRHDQFSC